MPLDLPAPNEEPLAGSPLALVVCQVRFGATQVVTSRHAADLTAFLQERGFEYAKADRMQTVTVNVALTGSSESSMTAAGWRLQSDDGWVLAITNETLSLETTRYGHWREDFRSRLEAALAGLQAIVAPDTELRLGLRFVDVMTSPVVHSPAQWRGRIADWLLAPAIHDRLGAAVVGLQQQLVLDLGDGSRATVRHGAYPDAARDGAYTYLLDCDVFRERLRPFDVAQIQAAADAFHLDALALFQSMITPAYYEELRRPA